MTWGPAILGQDEPEGFQLGNSKSGFGAAFTYVLEDGTQRVFVSANSARMDGKACATGKHPVPPYTSCTRNNDCPSGDKCKGIPTDKSWGLFEVQLPLKVPAACWNYGTDTKPHKRCDEVVPRGPNNPGAMLRLSMLSAPTGNGPVWELTIASGA